jgi:hypothetical protein
MTSPDPTLIASWRAKCLAGTITKDELREAYAELRKARGTIPVAVAGSRVNKATKASAGKKPIDSDDLLSQLEGL